MAKLLRNCSDRPFLACGVVSPKFRSENLRADRSSFGVVSASRTVYLCGAVLSKLRSSCLAKSPRVVPVSAIKMGSENSENWPNRGFLASAPQFGQNCSAQIYRSASRNYSETAPHARKNGEKPWFGHVSESADSANLRTGYYCMYLPVCIFLFRVTGIRML